MKILYINRTLKLFKNTVYMGSIERISNKGIET